MFHVNEAVVRSNNNSNDRDNKKDKIVADNRHVVVLEVEIHVLDVQVCD